MGKLRIRLQEETVEEIRRMALVKYGDKRGSISKFLTDVIMDTVDK